MLISSTGLPGKLHSLLERVFRWSSGFRVSGLGGFGFRGLGFRVADVQSV